MLGALRIVPELTHTDPQRHLYKVNKNFLLDKIRQFCKRIKVEESEARHVSFDDDDRSKVKADHEDVWGLAPGDDWTDAEYMERVNEILEEGPNIRHRIAFSSKMSGNDCKMANTRCLGNGIPNQAAVCHHQGSDRFV